jgi:lipid-binding SYLF domain-containing protein
MRQVIMMLAAVVLTGLVGCNSAPKTAYQGENRISDAEVTIDRFKKTDTSMNDRFFKTAVGWAVFPDVGKGGVGLGGAYGKGVLFEGGEAVGYCDLAQATIGFQLGGQVYSEIIFFQDDVSLSAFKDGTFEFAAQASAVAAAADASVNADYEHGVAVFTLSGKGLMYEASIGGQKFDYTPKR